MLPQRALQDGDVVPRQHDHELLQGCWDAAALRERNWRLDGSSQLERWPRAVAEVIVVPVEVTLELHHLVFAGEGARCPDRVPGCLGARAREAHQLRAWHELGDLARDL